MIIKNISSYDKSNIQLLQNGVNDIHNKNIQKSNNPIKSSICGKKDNEIPHSNNVNKVISPEMKRLIEKLNTSEKSELDTERGLSFLHQKKKCLDTIEAVGYKLENLSKQYKDSSTTEEDKNKIEKQAGDLLKGLDNLMNGNSLENDSVISYKTIPIQDTYGTTSTLLSKPFYITLEPINLNSNNLNNIAEEDSFNNAHFKNKVDAKFLLENTSIIEEKILNPVKNAIEDVNNDKSKVYYTFLDANSSATSAINRLYELGNMSLYKKNSEIKFQQSLYNSISSLRFQSSNIEKDNIF